MPYAHVDSVIQALVEPWFFGAPRSAGENYGKLLTRQFNARGDQAAVDAALGLGGYLIHTQANKNKRVALRAVMLASILMKGTKVGEVDALRKRCESLPIDALKRAFANQFPGLDGDGMRDLWSPAFFTMPILLPELCTLTNWTGKTIPNYQFIVHTSEDPITPSAVFQDPLGELSKYAASSFSLMNNKKPATYFLQGLIFKIPANNILVTYHSDLLSVLREQSVHKPTYGKHTFAEEIGELSMATGSGGLLSPGAIIRAQDSAGSFAIKSRYNELLICGKPGMPLPQGVTGALQLQGMFISCTKDGKILGFDGDARKKACKRHAERFNVPLLYLPNAA